MWMKEFSAMSKKMEPKGRDEKDFKDGRWAGGDYGSIAVVRYKQQFWTKNFPRSTPFPISGQCQEVVKWKIFSGIPPPSGS